MVKRRRARVLLFGALALLAALVPATLAFGTHSDFSGVVPGGVVILEMGNGPTADKVVYGSGPSQSIMTSRSNCTTVDDSFEGATLLNIAEGANNTSLGEAKDQIGVQSGNDGNGENCVRTGVGETMTITLGSNFASGTVMGGFDLDVQLKFDSVIEATTKRGGVIQDEFSFTGEGLSDSGPDSEDNRRWAYIADRGKEFDTLVLTASEGTFSIGGGKNIAEPGVFVTSSRGSQFAIGAIFDGQITCNDDETIAEDGVLTSGVVTMHSEDPVGSVGWTTDNCDLKPFAEDVEDDALAFVPELTGTDARYTIEVTVKDQLVDVDEDGRIMSLQAVYNVAGDLTFPVGAADPLQACLGQPILNDADPGYDAFWTQTNVGLLPVGEDACWYHASVDPTGSEIGTEHWGIFFEADPGFNFR